MNFKQRDTSKPTNVFNPFIQDGKQISTIQRPVGNQANPFKGKLFSGKVTQPTAITRAFGQIRKKNTFVKEALGLDEIFRNALNAFQYETNIGPASSPTSGVAPIGGRLSRKSKEVRHHRFLHRDSAVSQADKAAHDTSLTKYTKAGPDTGGTNSSSSNKRETYGLNKDDNADEFKRAKWNNAGIGKK